MMSSGMLKPRTGSNQRGQTLVIFALAATFLVGLAGLAIEGGMLEADRRFDQDISDGAALAGSHALPKSGPAINQAAQYAIDALWAGHANVPTLCVISSLQVDSASPPGPALPAACDPSPSHNLQIHTPYNGHQDQILVRLTHVSNLNLAAVVGFGSASIASRSVAKTLGGGTPFNYAVYAGGNMVTNGNANTTVFGNIYVRGCIAYDNSDVLNVGPSQDTPTSQLGTVEVYGDPAVIPGVMPQGWISGNGTTHCDANVQGAAGGNSQWGASGHASAATENCAPNTVFSPGTCPVGEPPVPSVGIPVFPDKDTTGTGGQACDAPGVEPTTLPNNPAKIIGGCYSACNATDGKSLTIPSGTKFQNGTYAFVGSGVGGCDVIFSGSASNVGPGDGSGGVTFVVYDGAWMCASKCGSSNGGGNLTFNAPTSGPFTNILVFSCFTGACGSGSGTIDIEGPSWNVNLIGTIYNPLGDCIIHSNSGQQLLGQLICNNVTLQGGSVSLGSGIHWSANSVGTPTFLSQLIE